MASDSRVQGGVQGPAALVGRHVPRRSRCQGALRLHEFGTDKFAEEIDGHRRRDHERDTEEGPTNHPRLRPAAQEQRQGEGSLPEHRRLGRQGQGPRLARGGRGGPGLVLVLVGIFVGRRIGRRSRSVVLPTVLGAPAPRQSAGAPSGGVSSDEHVAAAAGELLGFGLSKAASGAPPERPRAAQVDADPGDDPAQGAAPVRPLGRDARPLGRAVRARPPEFTGRPRGGAGDAPGTRLPPSAPRRGPPLPRASPDDLGPRDARGLAPAPRPRRHGRRPERHLPDRQDRSLGKAPLLGLPPPAVPGGPQMVPRRQQELGGREPRGAKAAAPGAPGDPPPRHAGTQLLPRAPERRRLALRRPLSERTDAVRRPVDPSPHLPRLPRRPHGPLPQGQQQTGRVDFPSNVVVAAERRVVGRQGAGPATKVGDRPGTSDLQRLVRGRDDLRPRRRRRLVVPRSSGAPPVPAAHEAARDPRAALRGGGRRQPLRGGRRLKRLLPAVPHPARALPRRLGQERARRGGRNRRPSRRLGRPHGAPLRANTPERPLAGAAPRHRRRPPRLRPGPRARGLPPLRPPRGFPRGAAAIVAALDERRRRRLLGRGGPLEAHRPRHERDLGGGLPATQPRPRRRPRRPGPRPRSGLGPLARPARRVPASRRRK
mmetsp:Transcript_10606/g.35074  ORF Transcript_10606/g.35074 Transcript_10606/m.35074 type:complete len:656 (+) Transcript_10606:666-2633(+)